MDESEDKIPNRAIPIGGSYTPYVGSRTSNACFLDRNPLLIAMCDDTT